MVYNEMERNTLIRRSHGRFVSIPSDCEKLTWLVVVQALRDQHCDTASMRRMIDDLLSDSSTLHDLYGAQLLREDVQADVQQFVPMIQYFVGRYIDGKNVKPPAPPSSATASGDRSRPSAGDGWHGRIRAVADIEENIWSPWLGIKGKVDLTVEVSIRALRSSDSWMFSL